MIGTKYLRYHPERIFQLPSGLTIFKSEFENASGGYGVVGGPHKVFTNVERFHGHSDKATCQGFLANQYNLYKIGYQLNPDVHLLHVKYEKETHLALSTDVSEEDDSKEASSFNHALTTRSEKIFNAVEAAGTDTSYRCVNCRQCKKCKNGESIEAISVKEEVEQDVINKSVKIDLKHQITVARLPFIENPETKLAPNKNKALAVYHSQIKRLSKFPQDKEDVIKSETKLQLLGFVDYVKNLSDNMQKKLKKSNIINFIPWRAVWNTKSLSTPCRIVFDASQATSSGFSLNDILAKGKNNMNRLVEIVLRWMTHHVAMHSDVQKMYNVIKLHEDDWCFQRYVWQADLDPTKIPEEKVIKTLIYGVKSSGNQAEHALRETAKLSKSELPEVCRLVNEDVYVDDCLSGSTSIDSTHQLADELAVVLSKGGFGLKGVTFSGSNPISSLSSDGESVSVAGMRWFPKEDQIQLDIGELNFAQKCRGKKTKSFNNQIPERITRRLCLGKVAEIFDLTGKITPLVAKMKLDLQDLVKRKLDWDDVIPDSLRHVWTSNFEMMREISNIRYHRAVIPEDAVGLDVETVDMGDASCSLACVGIYARYLRKNGEYSCQLIFGRSKVTPDGITQPRAELLAATLNAQTGYVVQRAFKEYHGGSTKLSDSQIVLHWIHNIEHPLKQWVRNRVVEIHRLSSVKDWKYVHSSEMIVDIGTRREARIKDVIPGSTWIEGSEWMKMSSEEFPVKSIEELILTKEELVDVKKEVPTKLMKNSCNEFDWPSHEESRCVHYGQTLKKDVMNAVEERYAFSSYLIDPNKHRFRNVVRILAIVKRFIRVVRRRIQEKKNLKNEDEEVEVEREDELNSEGRNAAHLTSSAVQPVKQGNCFILSDDEIKDAQNYFFLKATLEVKEFTKEVRYKKISKEENGILYFTGRILPTQEFVHSVKLTDVMRDLSSNQFCVPVIDKASPLAYSIVNEVHWYHEVAMHSGVETVHRYTMQIAYIIDGRDLVRMFRRRCERCRYLVKRTINVPMGPVSKHSFNIAPAFYSTQLDLAGPFKAFTPHNKRATVKIWYIVFCCTTTSTVNIKVMDDYSAPAFIQAFIRFACEVGYPKTLLPDEGSQLLKGCGNMKLNFMDLKYHLHQKVDVDFKPCPVGAHHVHGRVERKIRQIRESIERVAHNERLSVLEWETLGAEISNSINNLPLGLGSKVADLENLDLLTPNRLKLGRNNDRSPVGVLEVTADPNKFLTVNKMIFDAWFEAWMVSYVPTLVHQPKWFKIDADAKKGDLVIFSKEEKAISGRYQYGIIDSVEKGKDDYIRTIKIRYRNSNEKTDRYTRRSVRHVVMIHPVDELGLHKELAGAALRADMKKQSKTIGIK